MISQTIKFKILLSAVVYLFTLSGIFSQDGEDKNISNNNKVTTANKKTSSHKLFLNTAYFGEFIVHPGIKAGLEMQLAGNGTHRLLAETNLGYFYQPRISNNLFVDVEIAYRLTFASGIFLQINAGVGYNLVFVDGKSYDFVNGQVIEISSKGDSYFMQLASLAIGYDLGFKNNLPAARIYLKPFYYGQLPMNQVMVPNIGLEVGISIPLQLIGN